MRKPSVIALMIACALGSACAQAPRESADSDLSGETLHEDYLRALGAIESEEHSDEEVAEFRRDWRARFVELGRRGRGENAASGYAFALLDLLNCFRAGLEPGATETAFALLREGVLRWPDTQAIEEAVEWYTDLSVESESSRPGGASLEALRKNCRGRRVEVALVFRAAEMKAAAGDPGAAASFREVTRRWPDTSYADRARAELHELTVLRVGAQVPDFAIADVNGNSHSRQSSLGHPLWIYVFSGECAWCEVERSEVTSIAEWLTAHGVSVLFVHVGKSPTDLKTRQGGWALAHVERTETRHPFERNFNTHRVPRSFLIDRNGAILAKDTPLSAVKELWQAHGPRESERSRRASE